jgi:hypothetical protein
MKNIITFLLSDKVTKISFLVSGLILIILILAGGFRFVVWDQIRVQHGLSERQYTEEPTVSVDEGTNEVCDSLISLCFLMTLSHQPRILLTQPVLFFSKFLKVDSDLVFTFQVLLNFLITSLLLGFTLKKRVNGLNLAHFYWLALLVISFFMNGRLSYAFVGVSLFIAYFDGQIVKLFWKSLLVLLLAFLFTSVSSGVLFAAFLVCGLLWLIQLYELTGLKVKGLSNKFLALTLALIVAGFWVLAGVAKNLSFFKGSPMKMANHGYGKMILSLGVPALIFFILIVGLAVTMLVPKLLKSRFNTYLFSILSVWISLLTGLYGYSIIAGFTPAYLILLSIGMLILIKKTSLLPNTSYQIFK